MKPHAFYLAGKWINEGHTLHVLNPYTNEPAFAVFTPEETHVRQAIDASVSAFVETRKLPTYKRYEILRQIAKGIADRKHELASTIVTEAGKPMAFALGEVDRAVTTFTLAADLIRHWKGDILPLDLAERHTGRSGLVRRFPMGPMLAITPFNFPLNLVAHKVAPAIAVGNPILLKPASKTPVTALILAEIIESTDWPTAALSVLPCNRELATLMVTDDRIKKLSFTGSPEVGWALKANAGKKKVTLELGGDAAVIIDETAELESAAAKTAFGAFAYAGQVCISVQRILVHEKVHDAFSVLLKSEIAKVGVGDPREMSTIVGPIIDAGNVERIRAWVGEALAGGAKSLAEGQAGGETVVSPLVLEEVPRTSKLATTEAFGPVAMLTKFATIEEAFGIVNDSRYGLQAGIFTDSQSNIKAAFEQLEVGGVVVNDVPTLRVDNMPYGGIKDSGSGREGLEYAMRDMTELKVLVW